MSLCLHCRVEEVNPGRELGLRPAGGVLFVQKMSMLEVPPPPEPALGAGRVEEQDDDGDDDMGPTHVNTQKASHLVKVRC